MKVLVQMYFMLLVTKEKIGTVTCYLDLTTMKMMFIHYFDSCTHISPLALYTVSSAIPLDILQQQQRSSVVFYLQLQMVD